MSDRGDDDHRPRPRGGRPDRDHVRVVRRDATTTSSCRTPTARDRFVAEASALIAQRGIDGRTSTWRRSPARIEPTSRLLVGRHGRRPPRQRPGVGGERVHERQRERRPDGSRSRSRPEPTGRSSWATPTGSERPSRRAASPRITGVGTTLDLVASLDLYAAAAVPADRIILGLPYFGMTWPTVTSELHAPRQPDSAEARHGAARSGRRRSPRRARRPDRSSTTTRSRHRPARPGSTRSGRRGSRRTSTTRSTLAPKQDLAVQRGLAGIGMWALGDDHGAPGYWETVAATLGVGPPDVPPSPASPPTSPSAAPSAAPSACLHRPRHSSAPPSPVAPSPPVSPTIR